MAHRRTVESALEGFLRRRGIFPANGGFTEKQLQQELTRRGWSWHIEAGHVEATKASTPTGTVSTRIVSDASDRLAGLISVLFEAIQFDDRQGLLLVGPIGADIVVRARDQRVIAIGVVVGGESQSPEYAAEYRGNLLGHSTAFTLAPYFLMVWQDVGYLWDQRSGIDPASSPTLTFTMTPVISHYLPWLREGERPGGPEIAAAVAHWLDDLAYPVPGRSVPAADAFTGTDYLEAIQGASVLTEAAA